jgi:long-chain acyl-CoA synthetase
VLNLDDIFRETVRRQPGNPAIVGPGAGDVLSYQLLDDVIGQIADQLEMAGVHPGSCVGLHCPSGPHYIAATYAVWRCGGCVVPMAVELAHAEKQEILRTIAAHFVLSDRADTGLLEPLKQGEPQALPLGLHITPVDGRSEHPAGFHEVNTAFIRFTSGTTGAAKGVVLAHETIRDRIAAANEVLEIGPDDRVIWLLSMAYHFAVSIVAYLSHGATVVLPANHFATAIADSTRRHEGTLIYGSPLHYAWLAGVKDAGTLPSLRLAVSTTASLEVATADKFRQQYGLAIAQALGIIEVGLPFINVAFPDRPGAVGRVLPAYAIRLDPVGLESNLGEVCLSGKGFLDAYYHPWRPRSEIMPDGWFRTGDVGEIDEDGCLYLRGRNKDIINVAGMKFFPQDVEAVLSSHPGVASACVFGVPDLRLGETPHARVIARPGAAPTTGELLEYCRKRLAEFKTPQHIEFVKDLPRTASGKLLHRSPRTQGAQA